MAVPKRINRAPAQDSRQPLLKKLWKWRYMYLFLLPTIIYFLIFSYVPYYGLQIAFKDFKLFAGMEASPWVGFQYFEEFFRSPDFGRLLRNTILISVYRIIFGFPMPILFALLLNEVRHVWYKRSIQTITYFPNFLSWVVFAGIVLVFIAPTGVINAVLRSLGMGEVQILTSTTYFVPMLIFTDILKGFGFGAIIYLAALAGIDPQLYEAAVMDGAGKLRQIWHVTLPGIRSTIVVMLILALGGLMNAGFDQIFQFYNASVQEVADIIDTFVYRIGLQSAQYSLGTAVGLFKGIIGFILIYTANAIVRRTGEYSLW
ncbi:MAG: ABC transporter permease subunit [Anaerolinea sp.]|nr:ABC transporter permease subunit [Anaerolinea sp.]